MQIHMEITKNCIQFSEALNTDLPITELLCFCFSPEEDKLPGRALSPSIESFTLSLCQGPSYKELQPNLTATKCLK